MCMSTEYRGAVRVRRRAMLAWPCFQLSLCSFHGRYSLILYRHIAATASHPPHCRCIYIMLVLTCRRTLSPNFISNRVRAEGKHWHELLELCGGISRQLHLDFSASRQIFKLRALYEDGRCHNAHLFDSFARNRNHGVRAMGGFSIWVWFCAPYAGH